MSMVYENQKSVFNDLNVFVDSRYFNIQITLYFS